ncbi:hypothetical protein N1031_17485 [Herbiconiux moechotypicola]|uniref:Uncharacterized protein n=1 Tax=Herbiconiux moechotypicola TaxID=637393 RepID=A0ABP5QZ13_9MICO|nr:hypothetical protein [Herbiconiux moechotypicola]MCS5731556.1 hypothetical protein [Herbiconiux moechotypicola]
MTPDLRTDAHVSRRSVIAAGAWSVPVVALAVATPLAAASTTATEPEFELFLAPLDQYSLKGEIPFGLVAYDSAGFPGDWTGTITVALQFLLDDADLFIIPSGSDTTPISPSSSTWTFDGWSTPGTLGTDLVGTWTFTGTILQGDSAVLAVDGILFDRWPSSSASLPYSTVREATITVIAGDPASGVGNFAQDSVAYG